MLATGFSRDFAAEGRSYIFRYKSSGEIFMLGSWLFRSRGTTGK